MAFRAVLTPPAQATRLLAVAVRFLTRLPVPPVGERPGDLAHARAFFPLVGILVAAVGVAVRAVLAPLVGPLAATVAAVLATVAVTGALHEDGLADTFDGLWGGHTPARRLEILRDSRLGTYGTAALVGSLMLRVALLAPLDLGGLAGAMVVGHTLGRASSLVAVRLVPPADAGSAEQVAGPVSRLAAATATVTVAGVLLVAVGPWAPVPLLAGAAGGGALLTVAVRKLGGVSGDVLGAVNQVTHVAGMGAVAALVRAGVM